MVIPSFLLADTLAVKRFLGVDSYGKTWDTSTTLVHGHIEPSTARVTTIYGEEVTASLFAVLEPSAVVQVGDILQYNGNEYEFIQVVPLRHLAKLHHIECYLRATSTS